MINIIEEISEYFFNKTTFYNVLIVFKYNYFNCLLSSIVIAFLLGIFAFHSNMTLGDASKREIFNNILSVSIMGLFIEWVLILIFFIICCTISPVLFITGNSGIIQLIIGLVYYLVFFAIQRLYNCRRDALLNGKQKSKKGENKI